VRRLTGLTGSGIEIRYKSVKTFSTTVTKQSILEMAGWQTSVVKVSIVSGKRVEEAHCQDQD
jgi:hypothetical protein